MNKIQMKNHNIRFYGIKLKLLCLLTMIKNIYLRIDIIDYYMFINLLV